MYYSGEHFFIGWSDIPVTQETRDRIEQQARAFLLKHKETKLPISPEALAQREGLSVVYAYVLGNRIGELNQETKQIIVDERLINDPPFARCVIAHELGHYVLNNGGFKETCAKETEITTREAELEANYFAHALLMPRPFVEKAVEIYRSKTVTAFDSLVDYLCSLFNVTERKARHRLEELQS